MAAPGNELQTKAALAALTTRKGKSAKKEAQSERMKLQRAAGMAATPPEEMTDVQEATEANLQARVNSRRRARDRRPPERLVDSRCDRDDEAEYQEATGCTIVDLDFFNEYITRVLPCPVCGSIALFCRAEDEVRRGLGGSLRFWCHECQGITYEMPLSKELPKEPGARGFGIAEPNVRLVLGAAQIGAGETQMAQLFGSLNIPVVRGTTWANAEDRVTAAVKVAAGKSCVSAREEEMLAAYDRGTPIDSDGKVPITVEYDMCWAKRSSGKAYNSLEGSGSALGACTGKVLLSRVMKKDCDRCRKGICDGGPRCNRNYVGSSGGMESTAGGDMISELAQDAEGCGITLQQYVTDLDAKTAAAVRTKAEKDGWKLPEQKYDPGHWKKGFGKDLIEIKKNRTSPTCWGWRTKL
jgi:hypothetical protein